MLDRFAAAPGWTAAGGLALAVLCQRPAGLGAAADSKSHANPWLNIGRSLALLSQSSPRCLQAAGAVLLAALYNILLAPVRQLSKDYLDTNSSRYKAMRAKFYPPAFPNGWFFVCNSKDLENGRVKSITAFGSYLVAFRGKSGKVGVLDAFCPHNGANLGVGGDVIGDTLRCPFHAWSFNTDGSCADIPYRCSTRALPESTSVKAYEVREILDRVFVWFDAEGRPPQWELECHQEIEAGLRDGSFYFLSMRSAEFNQHVCDMPMNSADPYHFQTLHKPLQIPILGNFISHVKHTVTSGFWKGRLNGPTVDREHLAFLTEQTHGLYLFGCPMLLVPLSARIAARVDANVTVEGPSILHFTIRTPLGKLRQIVTQTPVEPFKQYVEMHWYAERNIPRVVAWFLELIAFHGLLQDVPVWETKVFRKKPVLVGGDGPFVQFIQWYNQFYSEKSPEVGAQSLSW